MIDYPEYTLALPPSCPTNQDHLIQTTLDDSNLLSSAGVYTELRVSCRAVRAAAQTQLIEGMFQ